MTNLQLNMLVDLWTIVVAGINEFLRHKMFLLSLSKTAFTYLLIYHQTQCMTKKRWKDNYSILSFIKQYLRYWSLTWLDSINILMSQSISLLLNLINLTLLSKKEFTNLAWVEIQHLERFQGQDFADLF